MLTRRIHWIELILKLSFHCLEKKLKVIWKGPVGFSCNNSINYGIFDFQTPNNISLVNVIWLLKTGRWMESNLINTSFLPPATTLTNTHEYQNFPTEITVSESLVQAKAIIHPDNELTWLITISSSNKNSWYIALWLGVDDEWVLLSAYPWHYVNIQ